LLKAMGAGPTGRITYAAGGRLDGIGRRAIGDMVSSAVASSFEMIGTLRERPTQPLSPESRRRTSRVQIHAIWPSRQALADQRLGPVRVSANGSATTCASSSYTT